MSFTLCTSGAAVIKAGTHVNSTILGDGTALDALSDAMEGRICAECHTDFVTNWASIPASIQFAISDVAESGIAMGLVAYDPTGYLRREADTLMNMNDDRVTKGLAKLKDKEFQRFST